MSGADLKKPARYLVGYFVAAILYNVAWIIGRKFGGFDAIAGGSPYASMLLLQIVWPIYWLAKQRYLSGVILLSLPMAVLLFSRGIGPHIERFLTGDMAMYHHVVWWGLALIVNVGGMLALLLCALRALQLRKAPTAAVN
ncbi:MAG: hypothetical protein RL336_1485 [Pseudomonadota bacterium]